MVIFSWGLGGFLYAPLYVALFVLVIPAAFLAVLAQAFVRGFLVFVAVLAYLHLLFIYFIDDLAVVMRHC